MIWLIIYPKVEVKLLMGLCSPQGSTIAGEFTSKLSHLTVGRRLSCLDMLASLSRCSQSGFPRVSEPSANGSRWARKSPSWDSIVFYGLISKMEDHNFSHNHLGMICTRPILVQSGRKLQGYKYQDMNIRGGLLEGWLL